MVARKPTPHEDQTALIRRIDAARDRLGSHWGGLRREFDIGARLQQAVSGKPLRLIGITILVGLGIGLARRSLSAQRRANAANSLRPDNRRSTPPIHAPASLVGSLAPDLLKFGLALLKPALVAWIARSSSEFRPHRH